MYKIILIDDERWSLMGLEKLINWEKYGFEIVAALTNPKDAIRKIELEKPDVVFTDISMPYINGLELIREISEKNNKTKFVILSAYSDFEYAQKAIKYKVYHYCLKPIKKIELINILNSLKSELDDTNVISVIPINHSSENQEIENVYFKDLISFINQNYNQKLQLHILAEKFGLNANYCGMLFKKHFDCSFTDYVNKIKMEAAADLLLDKLLSVYEISQLVGFDDYYYFNKVFKKHYNITPHKYRASKI